MLDNLRFIPLISVILAILPVMMALQILTGTWTWPNGGEAPPLARELWGIVGVGSIAIVWSLMMILWWPKAKVLEQKPVIIGDKPE